MFSSRYKGLDGLEKFEVEDMLSKIADIQKAVKDGETKRKRNMPSVVEERKHDAAVEELVELVDAWNSRPHPEPRARVPIMTVNGCEILQDPQAKHALHRLHGHLDLRRNPVAALDEAWLDKLVELKDGFLGFLKKSTVPDPRSAELWMPKELDPLPSRHRTMAKKPALFQSAPPLPDDELIKEEDEEDTLRENEGWNYYVNCREPDQMGMAMCRLLGRVKEEETGIDTGENVDQDDDPTYITVALPRHRPPPLPTKNVVKEEEE